MSRCYGLRAPQSRLYILQSTLALCVLLPFIQPWMPLASAGDVVIGRISIRSIGSSTQASGLVWPQFSGIVVFLIGAGILLRLVWILLGMLRLHRYRRSGRRLLNIPEELAQISPSAAVVISSEIRGPSTYGWIRPVILLPDRLETDVRVLCHELIHVRRKDWLWMFIEQIFATVFWFHPAVWWITDRIQLAREQVVDRETVEQLGDYHAYIESLLFVAAGGSDLVPAVGAAFLRRRYLKARIELLTKEVMMSKLRIRTSLIAVLAVTACAAWVSSRAMPLRAATANETAAADDQSKSGSENSKTDAGQKVIRVGGRTQEKNIVRKVLPKYPPEAKAKHIQGLVTLEATISKEGHVENLKLISGPAELVQASEDAVKQWEYRPTLLNGEPVEVITEVDVNYTLRD